MTNDLLKIKSQELFWFWEILFYLKYSIKINTCQRVFKKSIEDYTIVRMHPSIHPANID